MARHKLGDVVVLLPGILGSVLQRDGKDVWAPTPGGALRALWTLGRSLRDLRLDSDPPDRDDIGDGVTATRLMPDAHLIPGLWGIDGYSAISAMIASTFDVVPGRTFLDVPYDWRRDNRVAARRLAEAALPALHEQRKNNPDAKLILIGHSMGGLVARYFLECMDGWKDARMLVTFGTPYRGSLNALDFLANGFAKKIGPFKVTDLSKLLRSFTSVYQLLPIYPCVEAGTGALTRVADTDGLPAEVDSTRAYNAEHEFHRPIETAIAARAQEQPYLIHPIVGLTQPTLQSARLADQGLRMLQTYDGKDLDGDGTVPRVSATPIEYDGRRPDPSVYAPERHASLQNALSVQTQVRGLLTPVERADRFRDARGGLHLSLDDLHSADEEIPVTVTAGVRRATLVATVVDVDTKRPVAGPLPLLTADDQLTQSLELAPLPAGCYRLDVASVGESAGTVQPVHGLFIVADDTEPD
jgi:pimeloyl-ACP methyl ester carboxylesterase